MAHQRPIYYSRLVKNFTITDEGSNVAGVAIDYPNSKIARKNQIETITAVWTHSAYLAVSVVAASTGTAGNFIYLMNGGVGACRGVGGQASVFGNTANNRQVHGLYFRTMDYQSGGGGTITEMHGIHDRLEFNTNDTHTVSEMAGLKILYHGVPACPNTTITAAYGILLADLSLAQMTTYTAIDIPNSANAGTNNLLMVGPAVRYFEVAGGGAPGANLTNIYMSLGGVRRRLQTMDPGAGGANFAGGERVAILV